MQGTKKGNLKLHPLGGFCARMARHGLVTLRRVTVCINAALTLDTVLDAPLPRLRVLVLNHTIVHHSTQRFEPSPTSGLDGPLVGLLKLDVEIQHDASVLLRLLPLPVVQSVNISTSTYWPGAPGA